MEDNKPLRRLTADGAEKLDPTPLAVPVKFRRPETLAASVQRLVAGEVSRMADAMGLESFDDADDFEVEDIDFVPGTRYELDDGQSEYDIRRDDRYKEVEDVESRIRDAGRSDAEIGDAAEGASGGEQEVQSGGKGSDSGKKGGGVGKRKVGGDVRTGGEGKG